MWLNRLQIQRRARAPVSGPQACSRSLSSLPFFGVLASSSCHGCPRPPAQDPSPACPPSSQLCLTLGGGQAATLGTDNRALFPAASSGRFLPASHTGRALPEGSALRTKKRAHLWCTPRLMGGGLILDSVGPIQQREECVLPSGL